MHFVEQFYMETSVQVFLQAFEEWNVKCYVAEVAFKINENMV